METEDEVDTIDEIEALAEEAEEAEEPPEPPTPPEPSAPPTPQEAEELEDSEEVAEEEASEETTVSSKPYWQRVYDGDIEGPAFKHVDSEGNFTAYTLDEVLSSGKSSAQKAAHLADCIADFKGELAQTDYIALKLAEGAATAEEYAEQIAARQGLRDTINEYQDAIDALEGEVSDSYR